MNAPEKVLTPSVSIITIDNRFILLEKPHLILPGIPPTRNSPHFLAVAGVPPSVDSQPPTHHIGHRGLRR